MNEVLSGIATNYAHFFSMSDLMNTLMNPYSWAIIGTLVILEGLLSADNALVLAIMVKHLPHEQQKKALFYGIFGAYLFRFIAIGLGTFLIKIWWIKAVGAFYLLWLSGKYFFDKNTAEDSDDEDLEEKSATMGFWRTVLAVEMMDIAFSMDSVLAAFGVSDEVWVLYIGGILGVMMMRGVAQIFLILIEHYPELETTAYVLIALIGTKMMVSVFGIRVSEILFFSSLIVVFLSTFVIHHLRGEKVEAK